MLAADPEYKPLHRAVGADREGLPAGQEGVRGVAGRGLQGQGRGQDAPKEPHNPDADMHGNSRPGNIYQRRALPTIGYGIRGAIWYQGESNAGRAYQYRDLFPLMIQTWRDLWGQGDFSFYWVQLADFMTERAEPAESGWAELREAQTMTMNRLPHTGEAVIIDIGEGKDIHPAEQAGRRQAAGPVGARQGLRHRRSLPEPDLQVDGKAGQQDRRSRSTTSTAGSGPFDVNEPRGFAIAGSDRKFVKAQAKVAGHDKIEVWSDQVSEPVAVRYAWADNPVCNLYSAVGLPTTPFRTDDWPGVTINNK